MRLKGTKHQPSDGVICMHHIFIPIDDATRPDYWLHHPRSVADLIAMGEALTEGVAVVLRGPNGVERPAALSFQAEVNCWVAYPVGINRGR